MSNRFPLDNLDLAVIINLDNGLSLGSGFRLKYEGFNFLVSAKHVLYNEKDQLRGTLLNFSTPTIIDKEKKTLTFEINLEEAKKFYSKTHDVCAVLLGRNIDVDISVIPKELRHRIVPGTKPQIFEPEPYLILPVDSGIVNMGSFKQENTRNFDSIIIGNDVYIVGYPASLMLENDDIFDTLTPLIRKGIVAGKNNKNDMIIIDCASYPGNSGGPIFEQTEDNYFYVVGLVSRYIPFKIEWRNNREKLSHIEYHNSGYTAGVSMKPIYNLLASAVLSIKKLA